MKKTFSSIRAFVDVRGKAKFCVNCGNITTQEALFNVDGVTIIEKYCDKCAKKVVK
jgi:ribosomal protein S27AE